MGGGFAQRPVAVRAEFDYKGARRGILAYCPADRTIRHLTDHLTVQLRNTVDPSDNIVVRFLEQHGKRLHPAASLATLPTLSQSRLTLDISGCADEEAPKVAKGGGGRRGSARSRKQRTTVSAAPPKATASARKTGHRVGRSSGPHRLPKKVAEKVAKVARRRNELLDSETPSPAGSGDEYTEIDTELYGGDELRPSAPARQRERRPLATKASRKCSTPVGQRERRPLATKASRKCKAESRFTRRRNELLDSETPSPAGSGDEYTEMDTELYGGDELRPSTPVGQRERRPLATKASRKCKAESRFKPIGAGSGRSGSAGVKPRQPRVRSSARGGSAPTLTGDSCPFQLATLDDRKEAETDGTFPLLHRVYIWKMSTAPRADISEAITDPTLSDADRRALVTWTRTYNQEALSPAMLQLKFSFSVPTSDAIQAIQREAAGRGVVSAGAGTGYWEWLLERAGVDVISFDSNDKYPKSARYTTIETAGPEFLDSEEISNRVLLLNWPDVSPDSDFGAECVRRYSGPSIVHVGEMFGATLASDPWGQTTAQRCQKAITSNFRRVAALTLPQWPGHLDELSVWRRVVGWTAVAGDDGDDAVTLCHLAAPPAFVPL